MSKSWMQASCSCPFCVREWACSKSCCRSFPPHRSAMSGSRETNRQRLRVNIIESFRIFLAVSFFCSTPCWHGSASAAVSLLKEYAAANVRLLCIVAAPEGIDRLSQDCPEVDIYTAAVDRGLDERKYIVPGLGDFGDRLYGTP